MAINEIKNRDRVKKARKNGLNEKQNKIYQLLGESYNISSTQRCKMKYWSSNRIIGYLIENQLMDPLNPNKQFIKDLKAI